MSDFKLNDENTTLKDLADLEMSKQHYLTMTFFSSPILQSNAGAESDGNRMLLQKITMGETLRTLLSGVSIRYAIREALAAKYGTELLFRHHHDSDTMTGYSYGPNRNPSIKDGIKDLVALKKTPEDFLDWVFGLMVVEKDGLANDLAKGVWKCRSKVLISEGISTSPFTGESTFHQGINPENTNIAPYCMERHFSRYFFRLTFDLDGFPLVILQAIVDAVCEGLRIGGKHARAESELTPDAVLWRFYNAPGNSGMYRTDFLADPDKPLDLTPFYLEANNKGRILESAGSFIAKSDSTKEHPKVLPFLDLSGVIRNEVVSFLSKKE